MCTGVCVYLIAWCWELKWDSSWGKSKLPENLKFSGIKNKKKKLISTQRSQSNELGCVVEALTHSRAWVSGNIFEKIKKKVN